MKKLFFYLPLIALCFGFASCSSDDGDGSTVIDKNLEKKQVKSTIIFKQLYYTGSPAYYWQDGFCQLVNNSDEVQYLDGLVLGIVDRGFAGALNYVPSAWMEAGETRYPMYSYTVYFPGTGKDYPIQPGEVITIATDAADHTTIHPADAEAGDVASPVNLTNADWEVYAVGAYGETDNPNVPNLEVAYKPFGLDFMPAVSGESIILARVPAGTSMADYAADESNYAYAPGTSFPKLLMINADWVIDAVNITSSVTSERYRTVFEKDDAGFTFVNAGVDAGGEYKDAAYSQKALQRKVYKITSKGVKKYSDTNNSTADFETVTPSTAK